MQVFLTFKNSAKFGTGSGNLFFMRFIYTYILHINKIMFDRFVEYRLPIKKPL